MKWIAITMVVYLSALFAVPCSDATTHCKDDIAVAQAAHGHEQNDANSCSPFCYCACCSASIATFQFNLIPQIIPTAVPNLKKVVVRNSSMISNYYGTIWQPPQICA